MKKFFFGGGEEGGRGGEGAVLRVGMWARLAHLRDTGEMSPKKICSLFSMHAFLLVIN